MFHEGNHPPPELCQHKHAGKGFHGIWAVRMQFAQNPIGCEANDRLAWGDNPENQYYGSIPT